MIRQQHDCVDAKRSAQANHAKGIAQCAASNIIREKWSPIVRNESEEERSTRNAPPPIIRHAT
jgi:hypothetical protein